MNTTVYASWEQFIQENETTVSSFRYLDVRETHETLQKKKKVDNSPNIQAAWIPLTQLETRSFELPRRSVQFYVLLNDLQLEEAQSFFRPSHRKQKPWQVQAYICCRLPRLPSTYLWQPDDLMVHLSPHLDKLGTIYDLGAGVGRDVVYLAQAGCESTVAIDPRYRELTTTRDFLERNHVQVELLSWTLPCEELLERWKTQLPAAVFMVRYYNEQVLRDLKEMAEPTSKRVVVAIKQFGIATVGGVWPHKQPRRVLERNELSTLFTGWTIHRDEVVMDGDHGRTMIEFIAEWK